MSEPAWLADQFEHWRPHLASVAYGMLGSVSEAEDAVQQAWLRRGARARHGARARGLPRRAGLAGAPAPSEAPDLS